MKRHLITPTIFRRHERVRAAMTMRPPTADPFAGNMSHGVGDDREAVEQNRRALAESLGRRRDDLALQNQVHGSVVRRVAAGYEAGESDALISDEEGWLLGVSIADCAPILLFDPEHDAVGAVHSGWRGTAARIGSRAIEAMGEEFGSRPASLLAWIGPAAGGCCYEVGEEVAVQFPERHLRRLGEGKYLFDNRGVVIEQLVAIGMRPERIELDTRCTICCEGFHSYRRDGRESGRMLAVIGLERREPLIDRPSSD